MEYELALKEPGGGIRFAMRYYQLVCFPEAILKSLAQCPEDRQAGTLNLPSPKTSS